MRFAISQHSGYGAPPEAIDKLWEVLADLDSDAHFTRAGGEIAATWGDDAPISMHSDERREIGRLKVLETLEEVCERTPGLRLDWFAVGVRG